MSFSLKVLVCLCILQVACLIPTNGQMPFLGGRFGQMLGLDKLFDDPLTFRQMSMLSALFRNIRGGQRGAAAPTRSQPPSHQPAAMDYMPMPPPSQPASQQPSPAMNYMAMSRFYPGMSLSKMFPALDF